MKRIALSPPTKHTETNIVLTPSTGAVVETTVAELQGVWSDLAIELQCPSGWFDGFKVRCYTLGEDGAQLVAEWGGGSETHWTWTSAKNWTAIDDGVMRARFRVSGELSQGFRVTFTSGFPPDGEATCSLLAWNGSGPPFVSANGARASEDLPLIVATSNNIQCGGGVAELARVELANPTGGGGVDVFLLVVNSVAVPVAGAVDIKWVSFAPVGVPFVPREFSHPIRCGDGLFLLQSTSATTFAPVGRPATVSAQYRLESLRG